MIKVFKILPLNIAIKGLKDIMLSRMGLGAEFSDLIKLAAWIVDLNALSLFRFSTEK
jgi:hypothetical protein